MEMLYIWVKLSYIGFGGVDMIGWRTINEELFGKRRFKDILETENIKGVCEEAKCKQNTL